MVRQRTITCKGPEVGKSLVCPKNREGVLIWWGWYAVSKMVRQAGPGHIGFRWPCWRLRRAFKAQWNAVGELEAARCHGLIYIFTRISLAFVTCVTSVSCVTCVTLVSLV